MRAQDSPHDDSGLSQAGGVELEEKDCVKRFASAAEDVGHGIRKVIEERPSAKKKLHKQFKLEVQGPNLEPQDWSTVVTHNKFSSSAGIGLPGWHLALESFVEGEVSVVEIPNNLAFGDMGCQVTKHLFVPPRAPVYYRFRVVTPPVRTPLEEGREALGRKAYRQALKAFRRARDAAADDDELRAAMLNESLSLLKLADVGKADSGKLYRELINVTSTILSKFPDGEWATKTLLRRGRAYERMDELDLAKKDFEGAGNVEGLHRIRDQITTRRLELEKRRLNKLDEELHRHRLEYEDKTMPKKTPRMPSSARSHRLYSPKVQTRPTPVTNRDVKRIENRLSKSLAKLNTVKHENQSMRNRMDQLRRERLHMNHVFKKLQEDVKERNVHIKQIEAETESARESKKDAARQIGELKKQLTQQRREYKDGVIRLKQSMVSSEHERRRQCLHDARARKKRNAFLITDEECAFSDAVFMKRITKLAFLNCIQRRHIKQHQRNIEVFEQAFSTIKSTTGISDIEEIVKIFVKLEERNFSLLTYVNELNRNVDQMETRNKELGSQIQCMKETDGIVEQRRTLTFQSIRQQITATTEMTMEDVGESKLHSDVVMKCFPTVRTILQMIEDENVSLGTENTIVPPVDSENLCDLLHCVEQLVAQWKVFLPEPKDKSAWKPFPSTVAAQVKALPPKRTQFGPPLLRATDLPTTVDKDDNRRRLKEEPDDSESDGDHVWTRQELKEKTLTSLIKRKKMKKVGGDHVEKDDDLAEKEFGYDDLIERKQEGSPALDAESGDDIDIGPTEEEIREIFLKRYKMTKEELQAVADQKGIHLNNLCYLKQEFDQYDADRSGFIDVTELRDLLSKLGEEFDEEDLQAAFTELDTDGSGEIEFFEFVDWFTSDS